MSIEEMNVIKRLTEIGIALSREKDIGRIFEMIVEFAMEFTSAQGGTLYVVSEDRKTLNFTVVRNRVLGISQGGITSNVDWKPIPIFKEDGSPNMANVCSYCAITGRVLNIPDVYETTDFNFEGTKAFDAMTGYRSKSMLVVPMKNHEEEIIGVLQLINSEDLSEGRILPFSPSSQEMAECLASQAAIVLTNKILIDDLERLFRSSISVIAQAIDEKSPYTSGHSKRVTALALEIAKRITESKTGPFADIYFSENEMKEIQIASFLHDLGKITVPEHIMDKSTKLQSVFDRIELIRMRYELLKREIGAIEEKMEEEMKLIEMANSGTYFLTDEILERLKEISERKVKTKDGFIPLITEDELKHLSVRRGTLTEEERAIIESHAETTLRMLSQLPFPRKLKNVPLIAGCHHEKLDGTGYPRKLKGDDLPLKARILILADIFEALTARDRPYKKAKTLSEALAIMEDMARKGEIDKDLFDFFVKSGIPKDYAKRELLPEQLDL